MKKSSSKKVKRNSSDFVPMTQRRIKKVFLVFKRSVYQKYILNGSHRRLSALYRKKHPLTKHLYTEHREHSQTIERIKQELKSHSIHFKTATSLKVPSLKGYDLVITVGGDGTFLRASHRVEKQLMFGINSAPRASVGALLSSSFDDFPKKLISILDGRYHIRRLNRLEVRVNGKKIRHLALNDVLFCNVSPGGTSRYVIVADKQQEEQKSSGVWISSAAGSTAAIRAAGGKVLPHFSRDIQFLVREPYRGKQSQYRLTKGIIRPGGKIKFINQMIDAALYLDGMQAIHPIHFGDHITIQNSKHPVQIIL